VFHWLALLEKMNHATSLKDSVPLASVIQENENAKKNAQNKGK
jgi:hypothetical protein